jgi:hypothetical protein
MKTSTKSPGMATSTTECRLSAVKSLFAAVDGALPTNSDDELLIDQLMNERIERLRSRPLRRRGEK